MRLKTMSDFNDDTGFLYADPSFFSGVAAMLDLASGLIVYNTSRSGREADERAIASDWAVIGKDIETAIEAIEEEALQTT